MENDELNIIPIKDDEDEIKRGKKKQLHPNLPDIYKGELLAIIAPIRSGKSVLWNNLLLSDAFFNDMFSSVNIISNTIASDKSSRFSYKKFKNTCHDMYDDSIIKNLIKRQKTKIDNNDEDTSFCLILDDLLNQFSKTGRRGQEAISFASRFRHYRKMPDPAMLLYSTQRYFDLNRVVRNNATGLMFSGNIKSTKEWEDIMDDFADAFEGRKHFEEMIKVVQQKPFQWLYLKMDRTPPEAYLNFTTRLYPK
jgi:hypothetical protein